MFVYLLNDWFTKCDVLLPELLESGIKVLVYSGNKDFICNYFGGIDWVNNLKWKGQAEYNKQTTHDWKVNGAVAGSFQTHDTLTMLQVYDAGHMVPMNQPENALAMLDTLIHSEGFQPETAPSKVAMM